MIYFMILTVILFILMANIILNKKEYRMIPMFIFYVTSFILLLVISGFRGSDVGTDTSMYVRAFNLMKNSQSLSLYKDRFEIGYRIFNLAIAKYFSSASVLLFMSSLLILVLIFWIFKKRSYYMWCSIIIYILLMMYYNSMCLMRQYIAISISCIAIYFLSEKKNMKFIFFVLLSSTFHSSAIIVLILYPLSKIELTRYNRYLIVAITIVFLLFFDKLLNYLIYFIPKYSTYINSKYYLENQLAAILKAGVWISIYIFKDYVYFKYQIFDNNKIHKSWYKIEYYCAFLGAIISFISIKGAILERMGLYFTIINCITIPNALYSIENRSKKYLCAGIILFMCLMYNLVILGFRPYWSGVIPYSFWN